MGHPTEDYRLGEALAGHPSSWFQLLAQAPQLPKEGNCGPLARPPGQVREPVWVLVSGEHEGQRKNSSLFHDGISFHKTKLEVLRVARPRATDTSHNCLRETNFGPRNPISRSSYPLGSRFV